MRGFCRYWIILIVFLLFPISSINAQMFLKNEHLAQFVIGPGFFSSDAGKDGVFQFYNPRISVGFNYSYRLHNRWGIKAGISYGFYGEKDGDWRPDRGWEVSTSLVDLSIAAQFYILKRNDAAIPDLYLSAGVGGLASINPKVNTQSRSLPEINITKQEYLDRWNAEHPSATPRTLSKREKGNDYMRTDKNVLITPTFPISLGAMWVITKQFMLGVDYTFRVSTADYLDNLNPVGSTYPDMYSSVNFSVGYVFRTDCYTCHSGLSRPKFRRAKASSGYWF